MMTTKTINERKKAPNVSNEDIKNSLSQTKDLTSLLLMSNGPRSFVKQPIASWILKWIELYEVQFQTTGDSKINGTDVQEEELLDRMFLDANRTDHNFKIEALKPALRIVKVAAKESARKHVIESIRTRGVEEKDVILDEMVSMLVASADEKYKEMVKVVLEQWLWQTKRRFYGLVVPRPFMLNLMSTIQNIGKTYFVGKLIEPFEINGLAKYVGAEAIADDRNKNNVYNYHVMFLDELQKLDKSDVGVVKAMITAQKVDFRAMRTNGGVVLENRCSLIGASNISIGEMFLDKTGQSRFFQIDITDIDMEKMEAFNFERVWQVIDETTSEPFKRDLELYEAIKEKQDEQTYVPPEKSFYEIYKPIEGKPDYYVPLNILYSQFQVFCKSNGYSNCPNAEIFKKRMREYGLPGDRKKDVRVGFRIGVKVEKTNNNFYVIHTPEEVDNAQF